MAAALRQAGEDGAHAAAPSGCGWTKTLWDNWRRRGFTTARGTSGIGELRPSDLRHTFASLLLAEGRAIHYVAEQLGHGAEQTLRAYGHVIADYRHRQVIDAEQEIRDARMLMCPPRAHKAVAERTATVA